MKELLQQALDAITAAYVNHPVSDALREALAAPMPEPSDMVMVPMEPTPEMRRAGVALHQKHTGHLSEVITAVYRAMIAAAPPAAPAVPLTDEQIDELYIQGNKYWIGKRQISRAIEKAHGIGGGNEA